MVGAYTHSAGQRPKDSSEPAAIVPLRAGQHRSGRSNSPDNHCLPQELVPMCDVRHIYLCDVVV